MKSSIELKDQYANIQEAITGDQQINIITKQLSLFVDSLSERINKFDVVGFKNRWKIEERLEPLKRLGRYFTDPEDFTFDAYFDNQTGLFIYKLKDNGSIGINITKGNPKTGEVNKGFMTLFNGGDGIVHISKQTSLSSGNNVELRLYNSPEQGRDVIYQNPILTFRGSDREMEYLSNLARFGDFFNKFNANAGIVDKPNPNRRGLK